MSISDRKSLNLNGEARVNVNIVGLGTLEVLKITSDARKINDYYLEVKSHNMSIQSSDDRHVYLKIEGLKDESGKTRDQYCVCSERMLDDYISEFKSNQYKIKQPHSFFRQEFEREIEIIKIKG